VVEGEGGGKGEMTPEQTVRRIGRQFIRWWTPLRLAGVALLALAFLIGAYEGRYLQKTPRQIIADFYANASTELASIAVTILIVDALYQRRETEREKRRLILQMGSPDNAFAREAVRALQSYGWLGNGSLKGARLRLANLQDADLWRANLQGAFLWGANLQGANLRSANLQDADVLDANLQLAYLEDANLQGTNLVFGNLQWAKYNDDTTWPQGFTPPPEAVNVDAEKGQDD